MCIKCLECGWTNDMMNRNWTRSNCLWRRFYVSFLYSIDVGDAKFFYDSIPPSELLMRSKRSGVSLDKKLVLNADGE